MALGMLVVLSVVVGALFYYAVANQHTSVRQGASQRAFSLAEEGVSDGMSVLANSSSFTNPNALPLTTLTVSDGTITYVGSLAGTAWTVTGTGTVTNPAVVGGTITRTVSQKATVSSTVGPAWSYIYSDTSPGCTGQGTNIVATLFINGNFCMGNGSTITGSTSKLEVTGSISLGNLASVGTLGSPIAAAKIGAGCGTSPTHVCSSGDSVYATTTSKTVDSASKPAVDFAYWYTNASPGPGHSCTTGSVPGGFDNDTTMNASRSTFDLTPSTSYTCQVKDASGNVTGELSWNAATHILTIAGTIFIDGNVQSSSRTAGTRYSGLATLYVNGTFTMPANTILCAVSTCDATWDTSKNVLVVVVGQKDASGLSAQISSGSTFQGGIWAVGNYVLANGGFGWGPVIANSVQISHNNVVIPLTSLPPGAPGMTTTLALVPGSWSG
jgi:hypothetical protein